MDNGQQQYNSNSRNSLEDICTGGATASQDMTPPTSRFEIYDGPAEEQIYASINKVLSHSHFLANEENRETTTANNNNDDDDNVDVVNPEIQEHAEGDVVCEDEDDGEFVDGDDTVPLI